MKIIDRRNFASKLGFGFFAAVILSLFPLNFIKKLDGSSKKINIKIHPSAVSRKK